MPATTDTTLSIKDALARFLEGRIHEARKEGRDTIKVTTVDVQTHIASRCREMFDVTALPSTWARKFRILRNDHRKLSEIGVEKTRPVSDNPRTIEFVLS